MQIEPKRVMIFGIPGSGKSTFALDISRLLALPLFHLDKYFFIHDWQERAYQEFLDIQKRLVEQEYWIIDGNAIQSLEIRFKRADIVIYFRFNRLLCLWRICKRLVSRNPRIADRASGCKEGIRMRLIRYLWAYPRRVQPSVEDLLQRYPSVQFYELKNDKQVHAFLKQFKTDGRNKYVYKPYSKLFVDLFVQEKNRIISRLHKGALVEHIGSTAVPLLGGKGIIDIAIGVDKEQFESTSLLIEQLGYEFKPSFSTEDRLYFVGYLPDPEEGKRRYHIHLTYPFSKEWNELIQFRDYLRSDPEATAEYARLKEEAASKANEEGEKYRKMKEPFFQKIQGLIHLKEKR